MLLTQELGHLVVQSRVEDSQGTRLVVLRGVFLVQRQNGRDVATVGGFHAFLQGLRRRLGRLPGGLRHVGADSRAQNRQSGAKGDATSQPGTR